MTRALSSVDTPMWAAGSSEHSPDALEGMKKRVESEDELGPDTRTDKWCTNLC